MKEKTRTEIYNEKVSLIYEYDKKTPLFVRMAHIELQKNNVDRAVEILNNGLRIYPYFAAGHLLLAKAFTQLGSYGHAIKALKAGSELINSKRTFDYYFREIELLRNKRSSFEVNQRSSYFSPDLDMYEESGDPAPPAPPSPTGDDVAIEDRLEQLAEDIKNIKITPASGTAAEVKSFEEMDHWSLIVSETLAKIYVAQGELKEAIETYRKLIKKSPEKEEYYLGKIEELQKQLDK